MPRYLLDTDVMIDVSRGNTGAATFVDSLDDAAISIITAQELIVGARDKRDLEVIDSLVETFRLEHLDGALGSLHILCLNGTRNRMDFARLMH
jgi:predicted nucleic acid-binding protein